MRLGPHVRPNTGPVRSRQPFDRLCWSTYYVAEAVLGAKDICGTRQTCLPTSIAHILVKITLIRETLNKQDYFRWN